MGPRALLQTAKGRNHPLLQKVRQMVRRGELLSEGEALPETPK